MTTSLQRQLAALAAPSSAVLIPERRITSILFETKDAAGFNRETFYLIGCEGLNELVGIDPRLFQKYESSILFSNTSVNYERAVEDKEANDALNEEIDKFLISLSPYLMLKSALKCLEWLVNRFHIQTFNVSSLLECIMPYYDTKSFSIIIKVIEIERFKTEETREWQWLLPSVQTALPISKPILYSNSNPKFIIWMFTTLKKFVTVHEDHLANLQHFISFITSTIVGILNSILNEVPKQKDKNNRRTNRSRGVIHAVWSQMESFILETNLKTLLNEEVQSMIYVTCSLLGLIQNQKSELSSGHEKYIGEIMLFILKNHPKSMTTQVYLLLNVLVPHTNKVFLLKKSKLSLILSEIVAIGQSWDLSGISSKILIDNIARKENGLKFSKIWSTIEYLKLNPAQRGNLMKAVYKKLCGAKSPQKKWLKNFITRFEREYPIEFSIVCEDDPQFASDLIKYKAGENLLLMCQHSDSDIRFSAVKKVLHRFQMKVMPKKSDVGKRLGKAVISKVRGIKPDTNSTAQAILPRFEDDEPNIVKFILQQKFDVLQNLFTPTTLITALIKVISKRLTAKCTKLALRRLCRVTLNSNADEEITSMILPVLLSFLFPRKQGVPMDFALIILRSKYAVQQEILKQYSPVIGKKDVTSIDICAFSYNVLKSSTVSIKDNGEDKLLNKVFALLNFNSHGDIDKIIQLAESAQFAPTGNYPVTCDNFIKCIVAAEKKKTLSLDLIFTTIANLKIRGKPHLQSKIFQFVWKCSETFDYKNLCVQFLADFIKVAFATPEEQIDFWCWMIRTVNQDSAKKVEFYLLRTLQFLIACLEQHPQSLKNYLTKTQMSKVKTAARSRIVSDLPPAVVEQPLLEILLAYTLYHDSHRVRLWTLNCLNMIGETTTIELTFGEFIKNIISHRDEIITDKEQAVKIISDTLQKEKFSGIRSRFVDTIVSDSTEQRIATGLLRLCSLVNCQIFSRFLPTARDLLISNPESKILLAVLDCYDPSIDTSLDIIKDGLKQKQTHTKILSKLTREVVEQFDINWRRTVFGIMVEVVLNCEIPEIKVAVQRCVRKWTLESIIVSEELDKCIAMEKFQGQQNATANLRKSTNTAFSRRASNGNVRKLVEVSDWATRTEVVLELIQSKKRLVQKTKLIKPLFRLLKICIALEEQSPVEYLKQLILTSLTLCCYDDFKSQQSNDDWIEFNVETVIDCLRCSRNPQTHHHALILLNYAAQLYPEQVLHGVMSLFTFMGNSILRQDDSYSTQLIQQTVTTIIPTFVNTNIVRKYPINRVSAGIYFAFASAVQDIPVHRRLPVFKSLVETLNPAESMWQLCIIIINKTLTRDKKRSHLTADILLVMDIIGKFEPSFTLITLEKIYQYISELPIYERITEEDFKIKRLSQNAASKAVVDLTRKDSLRDVEILIYYILELVLKVCTTFSELEENLNYEALLEKCFLYSRQVSNIHEDKIFRLIAQRNLDILEKINNALEPQDLINTVVSILRRDDLTVKKKILDVLNNRIAHKLEWFGSPDILMELIDPLVEFSSCEAESDDLITVIQTAFISLKLISRHLASSYPDRFVPVFELTFQYTTHSNRLLRASAFACLGELFCLKALILPKLNSVCSAISKAFKASAKLNTHGMKILDDFEMKESTGNGIQPQDQTSKHEADMSISTANLLCVSTLTCYTKLIDQLGSFLGASFLQKSLVLIFKIDGVFGHGEKATNRKKIFDQRLKILLKSIATKIPLRNSLPSIQKVFNDIINLDNIQQHTTSLISLIDVLKETLINTNKVDFTTIFQGICDAVLTDFLCYRERIIELEKNEESKVTQEQLTKVEDSILDCLTTGIVLKVSEGVFRTFYHRIFDWAGESTERLITFYRFSGMTAQKLKSLFVNFGGYVINKAAESLNSDIQLTKAILIYFYHIFSNDREGFITTDRFNFLVKPLVNLIESEDTINGNIDIKDINNTLIQLAVATNDLNRWQYLIELISFKSQHTNRKVRLFVISTLAAGATELGKDFLPLLPPAVPFLAELLNDTDEEVELETKKMLLKLEEIVREPLQPYFLA